jgi:hypothetical protein
VSKLRYASTRPCDRSIVSYLQCTPRKDTLRVGKPSRTGVEHAQRPERLRGTSFYPMYMALCKSQYVPVTLSHLFGWLALRASRGPVGAVGDSGPTTCQAMTPAEVQRHRVRMRT